jgi:hypothetical protein
MRSLRGIMTWLRFIYRSPVSRLSNIRQSYENYTDCLCCRVFHSVEEP